MYRKVEMYGARLVIALLLWSFLAAVVQKSEVCSAPEAYGIAMQIVCYAAVFVALCCVGMLAVGYVLMAACGVFNADVLREKGRK